MKTKSIAPLEFFKKWREIDQKVLDMLTVEFSNDYDHIGSILQDNAYRIYREVDNKGDVAYKVHKDRNHFGSLTEYIESYIDWDALGEDLFAELYIIADWDAKIAVEIW